jgi:single-stranded-DNA-specific exonuclease
MAAGCTVAEADFATFDVALQRVAHEWLDAATLERRLLSDGPLGIEHFTTATVAALDAQVWGPSFEAPLFSDAVEVISQRLVGEKHMKLSVKHSGTLRDAIWFNHAEPLPARVMLAYRLSMDEYNGRQRLQMIVEAAEAAP